VVAGRYRLEQVLRRGPGRCEHRARDELLRRAVTTLIAVPPSGESPLETTLPMSARQDHGPGLAEVFDGGVENGVLYLVVPRLEGTCLAEDLATGPLPVDEVRTLGAQVAAALVPLHRHGCAHGALGAELVTRGPGGVTLTGLGVDEWLHRWAHHRTTPPHPAPEQRAPTPSVSPATDVFALGCLLRAAAGRLHHSDPLRPVLRAMTATDPAGRPGTAEVVARLAAPPTAPRSHPLAGTLAAAALAGTLALGGLVVHTAGAPAGFPGNATIDPFALPSQVAAVPGAPVVPVPVSGGEGDAATPPVRETLAGDSPQRTTATAPTSTAAHATTASSAHRSASTAAPSSTDRSSDGTSSGDTSRPSHPGSSRSDGTETTEPTKGRGSVVPTSSDPQSSRTRTGSTAVLVGSGSADPRPRVLPTGADRAAPRPSASRPTVRTSRPAPHPMSRAHRTDGTDGTDGTDSGGPDERHGDQ
jgi:serine/threonine-protein kinase